MLYQFTVPAIIKIFIRETCSILLLPLGLVVPRLDIDIHGIVIFQDFENYPLIGVNRIKL
jgi:hypothetical protein